MSSKSRPYIVNSPAGNDRLVIAQSRASALRHVAEQIFTARPATAAQAVELMLRGVKPEHARADDAQLKLPVDPDQIGEDDLAAAAEADAIDKARDQGPVTFPPLDEDEKRRRDLLDYSIGKICGEIASQEEAERDAEAGRPNVYDGAAVVSPQVQDAVEALSKSRARRVSTQKGGAK